MAFTPHSMLTGFWLYCVVYWKEGVCEETCSTLNINSAYIKSFINAQPGSCFWNTPLGCISSSEFLIPIPRQCLFLQEGWPHKTECTALILEISADFWTVPFLGALTSYLRRQPSLWLAGGMTKDHQKEPCTTSESFPVSPTSGFLPSAGSHHYQDGINFPHQPCGSDAALLIHVSRVWKNI